MSAKEKSTILNVIFLFVAVLSTTKPRGGGGAKGLSGLSIKKKKKNYGFPKVRVVMLNILLNYLVKERQS